MGLDSVAGKHFLHCRHVSSQFQAGMMQTNILNLLCKHAECSKDAAQPRTALQLPLKDAFQSIQSLPWQKITQKRRNLLVSQRTSGAMQLQGDPLTPHTEKLLLLCKLFG